MHAVSVNNIIWPSKCVRNNPSALNSMILLYSVVYIRLVLRSLLCSNFRLLLIRYGCTVNPSRTTSPKNISLQQKHTNSKSGSTYARSLWWNIIHFNRSTSQKKKHKIDYGDWNDENDKVKTRGTVKLSSPQVAGKKWVIKFLKHITRVRPIITQHQI